MELSAIAEAAIFGDVAPARAPENIPGITKEVTPPKEAAPVSDDGGQTKDVKPEVKPETPVVKGPSLFDAIRAEREAREAKAAVDAERETLRKTAEEAQARLKDIETAKGNMLLDAVGYLQKHGLSDKEIAMFGESVMYWLVPDKAPADLRARAVEAQRYRDQATAEEAKAKAEEQSQSEYYANLEAQITSEFTTAVKSFGADTYPDSKAWFADDHDAYAQSLMHTAKNLADAARKAGTQADLSIPSVAKALETDLVSRFSRVRGKAQQEPAKQTEPDRILSTAPETKLTPEQARLKRAISAAFGA